MKINDITLDDNIVTISRLIDKAPDSDTFIRENGVISYSSVYEIEKISLTVLFDIESIVNLEHMSYLLYELYSYPLVFIEDDTLKSMSLKFIDKDSKNSKNTMLFMLESMHLSIGVNTTNLVTLNLKLRPCSFSSFSSDYSFISYENVNGKTKILYGDGLSPETSKVYQDFFKKGKLETLAKISKFKNEALHSSVFVMSPNFTDEKPPEEYESMTIKYTDPSPTNKDGSEKDTFSNFPFHTGDYVDDDEFSAIKYVHWKGEKYSIWDENSNAIQMIEFSMYNNIISQPIVGSPYPIIQYIGKSPSTISMTFVQPVDITLKFSPLTLFSALLEKYNQNLLYEPRFSSYNVLKIQTVLNIGLNVEGFIPSQSLTETDSNSQYMSSKIIFIESTPSVINEIVNPKISVGQANKINKKEVVDALFFLQDKLIESGVFDLNATANIIGTRNDDLVDKFIFENESHSDVSSVKNLYKYLLLDFFDFYDGSKRTITSESLISFYDYLSYIKRTYDISPILKSRIENQLILSSTIFEEFGFSMETIDGSSLPDLFYMDSNSFMSEAISDIKIGDRLGMKNGNQYLGVSDPRKISSAPFLVFDPLISIESVLSHYDSIKDEVDKQSDEIFGDRNKLHNEIVSNDDRFTNSKKDTNYSYKPIDNGNISNLIQWIGAQDAGKTGFEGLTTIYGKGSFKNHNIDVTRMTVGQVYDTQDVWRQENITKYGRKKGNSSAIGKYQIVKPTLLSIISSGYISRNDLFGEETQNKCGFWLATAKSSARKGTYKNFVEKKQLWIAGKITESDFEEAAKSYGASLSDEWMILKNPYSGKGLADGDGMNKAKVEWSDLYAAMVKYPVWGEVYSNGVVGKDAVPSPAKVTENTVGHIPLLDSVIASSSDAAKFIGKWANILGKKNPSVENNKITKTQLDSIISRTSDTSKSEILKRNNTYDSLKKASQFDDDTHAYIQARDSTRMFYQGADLVFPVVKAYIVYGGENSDESEYALVEPSYVELSGIVDLNIVLNDSDNPVDVLKMTISNPSNMYSDQKMFWELFRKRIDFSKIGTPEALKILISSMIIAQGNRLQIRAGYTNNPTDLQIVFNGVITELSEGTNITLLAEGYGRELLLSKYGERDPYSLSSAYNSSAPTSIASLLVDSDTIRSFGKASSSLLDYISRKTLLMTPFLGGEDRHSPVYYEPESKSVYSFRKYSDDTFTWLNLGSQLSNFEMRARTNLIKNIYPEIFELDAELQYNYWNMFDSNRNVRNQIVSYGNDAWSLMKIFEFRHPNTYVKPMLYESSMTLFYGIKDQLYISRSVNRRLASMIESGYKSAIDLYVKNRYKRFSAVSQIHFVSSGVNLISNKIKLTSSFSTSVSVDISNEGYSADTEEEYWEDSSTLEVVFDDNLRPDMIRKTKARVLGTDSNISAVRVGMKTIENSVSEMYDGKITIVGNEKIKNGDRVFLFDSTRMIYGFVTVSECEHILSQNVGFITMFRPKLIAECKSPMFSLFFRKMSLAFIGAHSDILETILTSTTKSEMYKFADDIVSQIGVFAPGESYSYFYGQSIFSKLLHIASYGKSSDVALQVTSATISYIFTYMIGKSVAIGAYNGLVGMSASRYAGLYGRNAASATVNVINNKYTIAAYKYISGSMSTKYAATKASVALKMGAFTTRLIQSGVSLRSVGLLLSGARSLMIGAGASILSNPIGALVYIGGLMLTNWILSSVEISILKRDPVSITPLMIHGRPFVSGIAGAQDNGLLSDSIENMRRTAKSFILNISKIERKADYATRDSMNNSLSDFDPDKQVDQ